MFSDSEGRCAEWMGLIATRYTRAKKRPNFRFLGGVITGILGTESRIDNIVQERRKWIDACVEPNIFYLLINCRNDSIFKLLLKDPFQSVRKTSQLLLRPTHLLINCRNDSIFKLLFKDPFQSVRKAIS